jgi:preprotein translocase subunit Sec61beta
MKRAIMSRKKRREGGMGMPASSAGLMRFFQDESYGIKIQPAIVLGLSMALITSVLLAHIFF